MEIGGDGMEILKFIKEYWVLITFISGVLSTFFIFIKTIVKLKGKSFVKDVIERVKQFKLIDWGENKMKEKITKLIDLRSIVTLLMNIALVIMLFYSKDINKEYIINPPYVFYNKKQFYDRI